MTAEEIFLDTEVEEVIIPTTTGQIGLMENHTNLITTLDIGVMILRNLEAEWSAIAVLGGTGYIENNVVTLLVTNAKDPKTIDSVKAQAQFLETQTLFASGLTGAAYITAELRFKRARALYQSTQILQNNEVTA